MALLLAASQAPAAAQGTFNLFGGRRIAFARWHYGTHDDIVADLFLVDVRTGRETQLTRDLHALEPLFVGPQALDFIRQEGLVSNFYRLSLSPGAPGATPEPLTSFTSEGYFSEMSIASMSIPGRRRRSQARPTRS